MFPINSALENYYNSIDNIMINPLITVYNNLLRSCYEFDQHGYKKIFDIFHLFSPQTPE